MLKYLYHVKGGRIMLNMKRVGKKISTCRREKNMTQMEIADKLGISFQAVSNWERGETMPDIAKLNELSQLLDIPIDELLDNQIGTAKIQKLVENNSEAGIETVEEFVEIAPILKPEYSETLAGNLTETALSNFNDLAALAPYLSEETLGDFARKVPTDKLNHVAPMAPYLSEEVLVELIKRSVAQNDSFRGILSLIPYISTEVLSKIVREVRRNLSDINIITPVAPYLDNGLLKEIIIDEIGRGNYRSIAVLAPYVDGDDLDKLIKDKFMR
jgi:transcriptional regulator with XRE-family HTH domain